MEETLKKIGKEEKRQMWEMTKDSQNMKKERGRKEKTSATKMSNNVWKKIIKGRLT